MTQASGPGKCAPKMLWKLEQGKAEQDQTVDLRESEKTRDDEHRLSRSVWSRAAELSMRPGTRPVSRSLDTSSCRSSFEELDMSLLKGVPLMKDC